MKSAIYARFKPRNRWRATAALVHHFIWPFHTGKFVPNYGNQDTPRQWDLSVREIDGNTMHFAGQYAGTLKLQGKPTGDEPETIELDVTFDVNAVRTDM